MQRELYCVLMTHFDTTLMLHKTETSFSNFHITAAPLQTATPAFYAMLHVT